MTRAKKIIMWTGIGLCGAVVGFVGLVFYAIAGPQPEPVEGTDRPDWLPAAATDVFHRSREGFGKYREAEFTISERDFRAYAAARGWALEENAYVIRPSPRAQPAHAGVMATEEYRAPIPRALVHDGIKKNGGGTRVVFDISSSRAYYSYSHH